MPSLDLGLQESIKDLIDDMRVLVHVIDLFYCQLAPCPRVPSTVVMRRDGKIKILYDGREMELRKFLGYKRERYRKVS